MATLLIGGGGMLLLACLVAWIDESSTRTDTPRTYDHDRDQP